jgi:uridine kinase
MDVCLGRRSEPILNPTKYLFWRKSKQVLRDVRERGRDIEGIIKQWFSFVKPSYTRYVEPQRHISGRKPSELDTMTSHWPSLRYHHPPWHWEPDGHWYVELIAPLCHAWDWHHSWVDLVVKDIQRRLLEKSERHSAELQKLESLSLDEKLSPNICLISSTPQFAGINTILQDPSTEQVDFVFYFDRLASLLIER